MLLKATVAKSQDWPGWSWALTVIQVIFWNIIMSNLIELQAQEWLKWKDSILWATLYYYTTVVYLRILAPTRSLVLTVKVLPSLTNSIWRNFPSFGNFCVAFFPQLGHFRTRSVLKGSKVGIDGVVQVWKVNMGGRVIFCLTDCWWAMNETAQQSFLSTVVLHFFTT